MSEPEENPVVESADNPTKRRRRTLWDSDRKSGSSEVSPPPTTAPVPTLAVPPPPTGPAPSSTLPLATPLNIQNLATSLMPSYPQTPHQPFTHSKLVNIMAQPGRMGCRIYVG